MPIKLVVGLRNPGPNYSETRHNAGGWFVEAFGRHFGGQFKPNQKLKAELASFEVNQHACKALLPLTYMNQSGFPVRAVCQFYRIEPHEILVAHDDLDLPAGRIRLKTGGGDGGHNGLRDMMTHLGCRDFHRLRIGIGHPGHKALVLNYVLGKPTQQERALIAEAIERGIAAMPEAIEGRFDTAMNFLHCDRASSCTEPKEF